MANTTDYTRLLDGYTLLAIKGWVEGLLSYKAPLASPTFTGTVTLPTSVKIGTSTATGLVKYTNGTLSIDTNSYKTDYRYRPIQVAGTEKIGTTASTALNFLNGTHSVQFTYNSGLYAEVDLTKYKPNGSTAFLDSSNKIAVAYLPDTVLGQLQYVGTWNATTPSWPSGRTKLKGEYWICNTAGGKWPDGTTATGKSFVVGDWAIWTGAGTTEDPYRWEKVDNTDAISSITLVNGNALTGPVTIPLAASNAYGLIKVGYSASGKNYAVQLDTNGKAYVAVPWNNTVTTSYGTMNFTEGLQIGDINISVDGDTTRYDIIVPQATASQFGVVLPAAVRADSSQLALITGGVAAGRYYGIEMNSDGKLFANIPWTDTKYSADGTTLSLSGTTFSIKSGYLAAVATSGSYTDLSNKPTIPATNVIPATTTANKVLLSTTTSGTAAWSSWSTAGFLKTNASGVVSIDTNSYSLSTHTHTTTIATSSGTNQLTLAFGTKYAITAGGTSYVFTMPSNPNTDHYPTAFAWTNGTEAGPTGSLTGNSDFTAVSFAAIPSASDSQSGVVTTVAQTFAGVKTFNSVIQAAAGINIGNTNSIKPIVINSSTSGNRFVRLYPTTNNSSNFDIYLPAAAGTLALVGDNNHTHTLSIATDSGTNQLTLAYGTKYKLTAGGSTFIFTMPSSDNTNWYPTSFSWTNGTTAGPTGSLTGTGMSAVSFGAIPSATGARSGIVTTDTQTFKGAKSFLDYIIAQDSNIQDLKVLIASSYITFYNGNGYTGIVTTNTAGGKYININTYSQVEAENILKGLNSDGTSI